MSDTCKVKSPEGIACDWIEDHAAPHTWELSRPASPALDVAAIRTEALANPEVTDDRILELCDELESTRAKLAEAERERDEALDRIDVLNGYRARALPVAVLERIVELLEMYERVCFEGAEDVKWAEIAKMDEELRPLARQALAKARAAGGTKR